MTRILSGLFLIALGCFLLGLGLAFMAGRASAHDQYMDWKMPGTGVSCCHDRDCRPVRASLTEEGWVALVDGLEVPIPPERILKQPSPDGRSHWCGSGAVTFCFVPADIRS